MTAVEPRPGIGRALVETGMITELQLDDALQRQQAEGGRIGEQLVLGGAIGRRDLYDALADQWGTERIDLLAEPPDPALTEMVGYADALDEGWVPWRIDEGTLVIATTVPPDDELTRRITANLRRPGLPAFTSVAYRATTTFDVWRAVEDTHRDTLLFESQDRLAVERPLVSAARGLRPWQQWTPVVLLAVVVLCLLVQTRTTFVVVLAGANIVFCASILFKVVAALLVPLRHRKVIDGRYHEMRERERRGLPPVWRARDDADLPVYTVLVPAYREANIVGKLLTNLGALDYPRAKLDVMLLLEEDDEETIAVARAMQPPEYVRIVVVPPGSPQTKPRACNYGLALARGEFCVIYDAEDRPDPDQLRKAVAAFDRDELERRSGVSTADPLAVVQASLYYFNADYNVLTRMFAVEYAHWFEAMLPGMDLAGLPLPLGGTSNHFRTDLLRQMGGWDPYNVTEDADAGLRANAEGYRVAVIDSGTGEEACAETGAWIRQRTRWIKGYLVTAAVNTRHPWRFVRRSGLRGVLGMLGLIMATPLAFLAYPLALGFTAATYVGVQFIGLDLPGWVVGTSVSTFVAGNVMMVLSAAAAATWRYNWRIGAFAVFSPVYWLLHSVAAWRALYQVVVDPHRWEKTPHGLTEDYESDAHV